MILLVCLVNLYVGQIVIIEMVNVFAKLASLSLIINANNVLMEVLSTSIPKDAKEFVE
jgi:hypothetical protein